MALTTWPRYASRGFGVVVCSLILYDGAPMYKLRCTREQAKLLKEKGQSPMERASGELFLKMVEEGKACFSDEAEVESQVKTEGKEEGKARAV